MLNCQKVISINRKNEKIALYSCKKSGIKYLKKRDDLNYPKMTHEVDQNIQKRNINTVDNYFSFSPKLFNLLQYKNIHFNNEINKNAKLNSKSMQIIKRKKQNH